MRWSVILSTVLLASCGSAPESPGAGELVGRIELTSGYPAVDVLVQVEGTPLGAIADAEGNYQIREMPPGSWALRLTPQGELASLGTRRLLAATNENEITTLDVTMYNPGVVTGTILPQGGANTPPVFIAISDLGLATAPTEQGGFVLPGVAPGSQLVTLVVGQASVERPDVMVAPQEVVSVNFELNELSTAFGTIVGTARNARGTRARTVELYSGFDGTLIDTVATMSRPDGTDFEFSVPPGSYILRAVPSSGEAGFHPPVVLAADGYLNLNILVPSVAHGPDPDRDGNRDGVDDFPQLFGVYFDRNGDNLPDEWIMDQDGDQVVDIKNSNEDSDEDGVPDVGDNCPFVPNPNQSNVDQDSMGDVCDTNGTVITKVMNAADVRSSHQSVCNSSGLLDSLFQISRTNECNFDRAFFMVKNVPIPVGATIHLATLTLQDVAVAGSAPPLLVEVKSGSTAQPPLVLPVDKDEADFLWDSGAPLGTFIEERQGIPNAIDITTHVQNRVGNYYWDGIFLFMVGTDTVAGEAYFRNNAKITVSYTP